MDRDGTPGGVDRRTFLIGGGLLALAPWVFRADLPSLGGVTAAGPLHRLARSAAPRLSVGFLDGVDPSVTAGELPFGAPGGRAVPAAAFRSGERDLAGGAVRFRVLGVTPGLEQAAIRDVDLDALFPVAGHGADGGLVPFYAWTHRSLPQPRSSPGSAFPVAAGHGPVLGLRLGTTRQGPPGEPPAPAAASTVFTTGSERGMTPLRRGVYVLGFEPDAWRRPAALPHPDDPAWADLVSLVVAVDRA